MILTYKIKHGLDIRDELAKAKLVAQFAVQNRDKLSSKYVKDIGLASGISCQILRKYGLDKKCTRVSRVNLIIPGQGIRFDREGHTMGVPCLKWHERVKFKLWFDTKRVEKINQVELGPKWMYVCCTVSEPPQQEGDGNAIGVDMNATEHGLVIADPNTGKVLKLGRRIQHTKRKYRALRAEAQRKGKLGLVKKLGRREKRIIGDCLHKCTLRTVQYAEENRRIIRLEDLTGIRDRSRRGMHTSDVCFTVNSWPFAQARALIEYKARLHGVRVETVDPAYTSQRCSRCGNTRKENRDRKKFVCTVCTHQDHADANAAFNIAVASLATPGRKKVRSSARRKVPSSRGLGVQSCTPLKPSGEPSRMLEGTEDSAGKSDVSSPLVPVVIQARLVQGL